MIMAGGQGTRFWPWSVKNRPKQFLPLHSKKTMIQETFERYSQWLSKEKIYVVTTEEYHDLLMEQLPQLPSEQIILEPERKDTAPCVALTALHCLEKDEDEVLVMSPADQYISDSQELMETLLLAEKIANSGHSIVTLGIPPTRPETGYGYIKTKYPSFIENKVLHVEKFIEKPFLDHAETLINDNNVFWNSGIFVSKPSTIAYYMEKFQTNIWNTLIKNKDNLKTAYLKLPKISVDYAILEKADEVYMIPVTFDWDDLGTWGSLERFKKEDQNHNILIGNVQVLSSENCMIISEKQNAMVLGAKDLIIVLTEEGLLVCHKSQEQEIKNLLNSWPETNK
ncbi:mannose-1-phosphate guanylyltransferase [Bacillus oleivorans]|nr:sugar phosphate nucleotidyltransferase [Bacillus oleivorans]